MKSRNKDKFLWGVSTSAFQVEGHVENDMTEWEHLGKFMNDGLDPRVADAVDHWNRWEEDFNLLNELGINAYRFSVEWARIEPERGKINQDAIEQYVRMIGKLHEFGIAPMLTILHFSHPAWFHRSTPWHHESSIESYLNFVDILIENFLDRVPFVVTFNEPLVWLLAAYGDGKFPPGKRDISQMMTSLKNMLTAHRRAYDLIKAKYPRCEVGIAHNFMVFKKARPFSMVDKHLRRTIHYFYNLMIPDAFITNRLKYFFPLLVNYDSAIDLDNSIDFWGVNYYCRIHVKFRLRLNHPFDLIYLPKAGEGQSDLGWEIYPKGLRRVCRWLESTGKPIYFTENGIAADDDNLRVRFLEKHLRVLQKARKDGYPIKGYFHWSLLDNYEWLVGRSARFGLYHVDYDNSLERSMKPSGQFYRDFIRQELTR